MSIVEELGLRVPEPNRFQRLQQRLASLAPVATLYSFTLDPTDSLLRRLSRGRLTVPGVMAGLPVVFLTTTGARTGHSRTAPLVGIPFEGRIGVIGTNFARRPTPGWVLNLEADPRGVLAHGPRTVDVVAEPADEPALERMFAAGSAIYPGFQAYRSRIRDRRVRGFLLDFDR